MNNSQYQKSLKEVYVILKSMGDDIINKIPSRILDLIKENMDKNYIFILDESVPIEMQNISNEALGTIALIYRDYIAN